MNKIRILLADDHAMLRAGLRALLSDERDFEVVGEAGDGREAAALAEELRPDVVVMDISMPVMGGLEATRLIASRLPETRVLALTMHPEEQYLLQVMQAGGSGYVLKRSADTELMQAIRAVHRGEVFLYPAAVKMLLTEYGRRDGGLRRGHAALSDREEVVLKLTAEGYSNHEIGDKLAISAKTVDTYRQRIMEKLDLHHRAELVHYALDHGLLTASNPDGK
jgi:two-component system, NarL family, response regulator NreC